MSAKRFRFIQLCALALACFAFSSSRAEIYLLAPSHANETESLVLAFYYPWYGTPSGPGGKSRGGTYVHWENVDIAAKKIGSSTNYPHEGPYDSHHPVIHTGHSVIAHRNGIDGFIISWWGENTFEDQAVKPLLDACEKEGIRACIYYEQVPKGGTPQSVADELTGIVKKYGSHHAYLTVNRDGNDHPVVFVYGRAVDQLGIDKWKAVQDLLAAGKSPRPLLIGDNFSKKAVDIFDGAHNYGPAGDLAAAIKRGESYKAWAAHTIPWWANCGEGGEAARTSGKISCVTVFPGYDDTKVRKPGLVVKRDDGKLYEELWLQAVKAKPDWVLITSFNEWHEGSEIEPSIEEGSKYMKMTKEWAGKFKEARK